MARTQFAFDFSSMRDCDLLALSFKDTPYGRAAKRELNKRTNDHIHIRRTTSEMVNSHKDRRWHR